MMHLHPHKERPGMCGPTSLQIVLEYYGIHKTEKELAKISHANPQYGTRSVNLVKTANALGFKAKIFDNSSIKKIEYFVSKKIPVIINWFSCYEGHYSVVAGIDKKNIYIEDPELDRINSMSIQRFLGVWFDFEGNLDVRRKKDMVERRLIAIWK